jgi:hypothetical protein
LWYSFSDSGIDRKRGKNMAANRVGRKVRPYLQKAKDSALLAVEVYNKPGTSFKSAAYIALMTIAWTSLFHAIFLKNGKNPYRKAKNGRYEIIEGDYRHWELKECTRQYWKNDSENPVRKNDTYRRLTPPSSENANPSS